jgi:hypothetical protein
MNYWAGLNSNTDQENIRRGAENPVNVAQSMQNEGRRGNLRIEDGGANQNSNNEATGVVQDAAAGDDEDEMMKTPLSDRFCRNRKISWLPFSLFLGAGCFPPPSLLVVTSVPYICKPLSPGHASSRRRFTFQSRLSFTKTWSFIFRRTSVALVSIS